MCLTKFAAHIIPNGKYDSDLLPPQTYTSCFIINNEFHKYLVFLQIKFWGGGGATILMGWEAGCCNTFFILRSLQCTKQIIFLKRQNYCLLL